MKRSVISIPSPLKTLRFPVAGLALVIFLDGPPLPASAQNIENDHSIETGDFAPGAIEHAQKMRKFKDADRGEQATPSVIPQFSKHDDPSGTIATFQPNGPTSTEFIAFFQDLASTNGRTCFTCHQPEFGWSVSAAGAQARFDASAGADPLFRVFDGSTCPPVNVSTLEAKRDAYKLLTGKGLIRIPLPMPPPAILQFEVTKVDDALTGNCTSNPATGLNPRATGATGQTTGMMSMYRRMLPSANVAFLGDGIGNPAIRPPIMWDGREPSLEHQSVDATLGHAQASTAPTADQQKQMAAFQKGIFTAQEFDDEANNLHARNAAGGPVALSKQLAKFFIGVNDGAFFNPNVFDLYKPWLGLRREDDAAEARLSVARGEGVFNDQCTFCHAHETPNVGNHSIKAFQNIGIADANPPRLFVDISGLPVFTLTCKVGLLAGKTFFTTDPGRAMITGQCADIGKFKVPMLRGLAARAPYFHNGGAATLLDAVNFYNTRFGLGFTDQQKQDLVNFLNTL